VAKKTYRKTLYTLFARVLFSRWQTIFFKKWDENNESVKKFIKYILSVPVQKALSEHNYEYPITTTSDSELVKTLGKKQNLKMEDIKETSITQEEIAKVRNNVLKIIKEVEIEKWI